LCCGWTVVVKTSTVCACGSAVRCGAVCCCQGMSYLHSSMIECHGQLSSKSVVVDGRWTCKITDYGLPYLRSLVQTVPSNTGLQPHCFYLHDRLQWCNQDFSQDQDLNFKTKTKTKPTVQHQDQDLFVMYTRGRPKSIYHFWP